MTEQRQQRRMRNKENKGKGRKEKRDTNNYVSIATSRKEIYRYILILYIYSNMNNKLNIYY